MARFEETTLALNHKLSSYVPCVNFSSALPDELQEQRIGPLIDKYQTQRRLFYGIEIFPRTEDNPVCLDFSRFLPVLPLFVSIAWLGKSSWNVEPIDQVESLQLAKHLAPRIPVMPHLTLYRMSDERLDQFLNLNFSNVLALRGDIIHPKQSYHHSKIIVDKVKGSLDDEMSVCVGGYPEGYSKTQEMPPNLTIHLKFLKEKENAGADCIITQACYQPETIINYVKEVRSAGITIPILVGVTAHETYKKYKTIERLQGSRLSPRLYQMLVMIDNAFKEDPEANLYYIRKFFVQVNVNIICHILKAGIEVFGFQIFTLNNFESTSALLDELQRQQLFDGKRPELCKPLDISILEEFDFERRTGHKPGLHHISDHN